jgi:ubiquitin-conjugating enzyme E2 J1
METDAKGQLGGLDTSEPERRRCAELSGGWKCAVCGRSNGEILAECEEAAKALEEEGGRKLGEEKVPEGLVIGSREDLGLSDSGAAGKEKEGEDTEAELAEGFVQTQPLPVHNSTYPAAQPGQTVTRLTRTTASQPLPQTHVHQAPAAVRRTQIQQHVSSEGVPLWVDRAIAGIVICLVVMILKMLLSL